MDSRSTLLRTIWRRHPHEPVAVTIGEVRLSPVTGTLRSASSASIGATLRCVRSPGHSYTPCRHVSAHRRASISSSSTNWLSPAGWKPARIRSSCGLVRYFFGRGACRPLRSPSRSSMLTICFRESPSRRRRSSIRAATSSSILTVVRIIRKERRAGGITLTRPSQHIPVANRNYSGSASDTSDPGRRFEPPAIGTTMYCRPSCM